jgi:hypothetical protein
MLTVFSMPKPFRGHIRVIQYNAIKSWTLLGPGVEVILLGDEPGTAEACRDLGVRHEPHVERNEFGTPLLNSVFSRARELASREILCYSNCDIILPQTLVHALNIVSGLRRQFLIVGRRWDLDVTTPLDFSQSGWNEQLTAAARQRGIQRPDHWIDHFSFRGDFWKNMPAFAVGRAWWDNWFIWNARDRGIPVIDASAAVTAVHQNHDYSHHPQGKAGVLDGEEAQRSFNLAGGRRHIWTIADSSHVIGRRGIQRSYRHWRRQARRELDLAIIESRPARLRYHLTWTSLKNLFSSKRASKPEEKSTITS